MATAPVSPRASLRGSARRPSTVTSASPRRPRRAEHRDPALFVLGIGALVYALSPRLVSPVVYGLVVWSFILGLTGSSIKANHWLRYTEVFSHIPPVPAADFNWSAVARPVGLGLADLRGRPARSVHDLCIATRRFRQPDAKADRSPSAPTHHHPDATHHASDNAEATC
jgi:hypothetical protein